MKQWYYAKNGQQFGPFQRSTVEDLFQKGEITASDLVWEEGTPTWVAAATVFTKAESTPGPAAAAGPAAVFTPSASSTAFSITDCISQAWDLLWKQPSFLIGGSFIVLLLMMVVQSPSMVAGGIEGFATAMAQKTHQSSQALTVATIPLRIVGGFLSMLLSPLIYGGLFYFMLRILRGNPGNFSELFEGFRSRWLELLLAGVVGGIITLIGFLCCIVPGIYLGVAYAFALPLVIDKKMGFWDALECSRKVVTEKWFEVFGLLFLGGLIYLAGLLLCCVGGLISYPLMILTLLFAYESLFKDIPPAA